jgi:hypothetical protein
MNDDRQVSVEEGQQLAAEFDPPMKFFETSAKQNINVDSVRRGSVEDGVGCVGLVVVVVRTCNLCHESLQTCGQH